MSKWGDILKNSLEDESIAPDTAASEPLPLPSRQQVVQFYKLQNCYNYDTTEYN